MAHLGRSRGGGAGERHGGIQKAETTARSAGFSLPAKAGKAADAYRVAYCRWAKILSPGLIFAGDRPFCRSHGPPSPWPEMLRVRHDAP